MYSFVKKILITLESRPIILLKIKLNILKSSNNKKSNDWKYDNSHTKCIANRNTIQPVISEMMPYSFINLFLTM